MDTKKRLTRKTPNRNLPSRLCVILSSSEGSPIVISTRSFVAPLLRMTQKWDAKFQFVGRNAAVKGKEGISAAE